MMMDEDILIFLDLKSRYLSFPLLLFYDIVGVFLGEFEMIEREVADWGDSGQAVSKVRLFHLE